MGETDRQAMADRVANLKKNLIDLEAAVKKRGVDAEAEWSKTLAALREKLGEAEKRVQEAADGGADAWDEMRDGVDDAVSSLQLAYQQAMAKL
jgi:hypothetical protein